jgi:hypothetical protein
VNGRFPWARPFATVVGRREEARIAVAGRYPLGVRTWRIVLGGVVALAALFVLFVLLKRDTKMPESRSSASVDEQEYPTSASSARPSPSASGSFGPPR